MQALTLLIIVLFVALIIFLIWYNSAKQKGKRGEMRILSILSQLPKEYTTLNDLVYRTNKGTTQIDHLVVSKYGIFAIETKNYRGDIYGDDKRNEWTQIIVTKVTYGKKWWKTYTYVTKNNFYNPVKQSIGHVYGIKDILSAHPHLMIVPIVVFTGNATLSNVYSKHHVIYEEDLLPVINMYNTIYLTDVEVQAVLKSLLENNVRDVVSNKEHVRNIRAIKKEIDDIIKSGICPKCGGTLVQRNGKYGSFYGCSNYPRCNYTIR